jgi:tetratricopeptide (TPR) repeat protein
MRTREPYVFVSYASADREQVTAIVDALYSAGIRAWLDQRAIDAGANWGQEIAEAIEGCSAFVLMSSVAALASRNVRQEIAIAWKYGRPYLPLLLDSTPFPKEIEYWLETAQWVEVLDRPAADWLPRVQRAIERLADATGADSGAAPTDPDLRIAAQRRPDHALRPRQRRAPFLVGREPEQAQLQGWLEESLAGRGGLVLVGGEAGIGKTALTDWLLWAAEERGALALSGACYDLATTPPYGPWVEILRAWPTGAGLPPAPAELRDAVALEAVASQAALFDLAARFLAASSAARPLVLQLEDLHWIDQASLDLLRYLARQLVTQSILIVGTYRLDELHRRHPLYTAIPALLRDGDGRQLELRQLNDDAVLQLVQDRYPLPQADTRRLVEYVQGRAEGHALYLRELLLTIEEGGLLTREGDGWVLGDLRQAGVPSLIRQVIEQRLARLGGEAHAALSVAAVIGHEAPLDVWSEVSERTEDALLNVIDRAVEARVLTAAPDGLSVAFTHALIREALYEGITSPRRRVWHRRVGEALLARPRPDPDALAWHFQRASDPRATDWLIEAGERAQRAAAWTIAAERFVAALPGLEADPARDLQRAKLMYRIGRLLRFHDTALSRGHLEDARKLALACGDGRLAAHARFSIGQATAFSGNWGSGLAEMEAAVAEWDAADVVPPDSGGQNPDLGGLAMYLGLAGRFHDAVACAERFLGGGLVQANPDDVVGTPEADALFGLGAALAGLGYPERALQPFHDAQSLYDAAGNMLRSGASRGLELLSVVLPYQTDDLDRRSRLVEETRDSFQRGRAAGQGLGYPQIGLLEVRWMTGDWDASEAEPDNTRMILGGVSLAQISSAWYRGDAEAAWRLMQGRFPDGSATPASVLLSPEGVPKVLRASAMCLEIGNVDHARSWLQKLDEVMQRRGGVLFQAERQLLWARYQRLTGDHAAALATAQAALARASEPRQPYALLQAHRVLGQLTTEAGELDTAARCLSESLALAEACAFPFERALTLVELAELQLARDDHPAASASLAEVHAICEPLRAQRVLDRVAGMEARMAAR